MRPVGPRHAPRANEHTKIYPTARSHDAAGNLTDNTAYTYEWDYATRLTRVEGNGDSGTLAVLDYDALSRRVVKYDAVDDVTLRFYCSDGNSSAVSNDVLG